MSLIRSTIRMCAVAACRNRTWAEDRVFDSDNTPLLDALKEQSKPYITVFTDADITQEIFGRDLYAGDHRMSLVFEFGIAAAAEVPSGNTVLKIPQTDQAMEALVDIMETQIVYAALTDPYSPFGELMRRMINKVVRAPSNRGGSEDRTTRWAARQLTLVCDTISSPGPGVVLDEHHPINDFISMVRAPEYASLGMKEAGDLLAQFLNTTAYPDWRQGQGWLGLTDVGMRGTGLAPEPTGDETGHEMTEVEPDDLEDDPTDWPVWPLPERDPFRY